MKNRSCPDKIACWDYDANNCEGCAVGDLILQQKKTIKHLKSELKRYKRALYNISGRYERKWGFSKNEVDSFLRKKRISMELDVADKEIEEERK